MTSENLSEEIERRISEKEILLQENNPELKKIVQFTLEEIKEQTNGDLDLNVEKLTKMITAEQSKNIIDKVSKMNPDELEKLQKKFFKMMAAKNKISQIPKGGRRVKRAPTKNEKQEPKKMEIKKSEIPEETEQQKKEREEDELEDFLELKDEIEDFIEIKGKRPLLISEDKTECSLAKRLSVYATKSRTGKIKNIRLQQEIRNFIDSLIV